MTALRYAGAFAISCVLGVVAALVSVEATPLPSYGAQHAYFFLAAAPLAILACWFPVNVVFAVSAISPENATTVRRILILSGVLALGAAALIVRLAVHLRISF